MTRFTPWRRWCRKAPKGGKRPKAANHRNAILAYESKSIKPESARSWQQESDCFCLYRQRLLPADGYLLPIILNAAHTEILHFVQNDASDRKILLSTVEVLHRTAKSAEVGL